MTVKALKEQLEKVEEEDALVFVNKEGVFINVTRATVEYDLKTNRCTVILW